MIRAAWRDTRWWYVEPDRDTLEFTARGRIELHYERIVPRYDVALVRHQREQPIKTLQHFPDMEGRRERPAAGHVLVEMTDVGGDHDKSAGGLDADKLKPRRMSADRMHRQAGRKLGVAIVEHHAAGIVQPHHPADVLDLERMRQPRILHVAPGGIEQFAFLQMKPRLRKAVEISDMVVMQMGQNDVFNRIGIDTEGCERLHRVAQECALAPCRYFGVEAGIDHKGSAAAFCHPDEIIHRHRPIMRIATDKVVAAPRLTGGITERKQLVIWLGHVSPL